MYDRIIEDNVHMALSDTPVVLITGPRQSGKTTLVREILDLNCAYRTLDNEGTRRTALNDPYGFVRDFDKLIIDEVQRVPELAMAIKRSVDEDDRPGRFILSGSANMLHMPKFTNNLVGRMEHIELLPLAQTEILGSKPTFLDRLFLGELEGSQNATIGDNLINMVLAGGLPRIVAKSEVQRRRSVLSYLRFLASEDLMDAAKTENLDFEKLTDAMAAYSGQLINYSKIAGIVGVSVPTVQRYVKILERLYVVSLIQPWHTNDLKRLVKTPRSRFLDSGVVAVLKGQSFKKIKENRDNFGAILESFVFSEVMKLKNASSNWYRTYFFQNHEKFEVDIVLERHDGMIAGIVVKSSTFAQSRDFAGLKALRDVCGDKFAFGAVLCDCKDREHFEDRLATLPISSLWM